MGYERSPAGAERLASRRAALRAQGLRPRTFWLPDMNSDAFKEQAQRDCQAINAMSSRDEDMLFLAAVQYWPEDKIEEIGRPIGTIERTTLIAVDQALLIFLGLAR